jgi:hypothetical protein
VLENQGPGGSHDQNLHVPVVVEKVRCSQGGDRSLAESSGQYHHGVFLKGFFRYGLLVESSLNGFRPDQRIFNVLLVQSHGDHSKICGLEILVAFTDLAARLALCIALISVKMQKT